jgi:hypothetical protein
MAYAVAEADDDDALRLAKALTASYGGKIDELKKLGIERRSPDGHFISAMDHKLNVLRHAPSRDEIERIKAIMWSHRRYLPAHVRPRLPPHDPIVQEMERQNG